ncbi:MAG TPA: hypothetical protein VMB78_10040 [Dissulfurispiraceae bacterium]|nr:hypothetical protein [Dissulfurispiraceae bacterium]
MILPSIALFSIGAAALCIGTFMSVKDHADKQMKCKKCGTREMHATAGNIVCKNGHRIKIEKK